MPRYKSGDLVFHCFHGIGTVIRTQRMDVIEADQLYYLVKLLTGGMLMMPVKEAEEVRLHPLMSAEDMGEVLSAAPQELAEDARQRRGHIEQKVHSGDQTQIVEVLRDLAWREHRRELSRADKEFMTTVKKLLTSVLAMQPDVDRREASLRLEAILEQSTRWGERPDSR